MGTRCRRILIIVVTTVLSWFWFSTNQPKTVPAVHDGLDSVIEGEK